MKVLLETKLGHMSIPDATSIQFNEDEVFIFTATNGFTKLREVEIHNITFLADESVFKQTKSIIPLMQYIQGMEGCSMKEALAKAKLLRGD